MSKDVIPFGYVKYRPVILPIEKDRSKYRMIPYSEAMNRAFILLAKWLNLAEKSWNELRTSKSVKNFPSVLDRLNYQKTLVKMSSTTKYFMVWNARGADSFGYVIDVDNLPQFIIKGRKLKPAGFVPDYTLYCFTSNNFDEIHYLCAVTNSRVVHEAVKPFQPRGLYGKRDIGRRIFRLPILNFDSENEDHKKLSQLSIDSHVIVESLSFTTEGFRSRRNNAKKVLKENLDKIDSIVAEMLN